MILGENNPLEGAVSLGRKSYLVTGGTGFLGSALVRRLIHAGHRVCVFDNNSRGRTERLKDIEGEFEFFEGDIRNLEAVERASKNIDGICHLAFVNGTEFFYTKPELVLDVGVKGMVNVIDACLKNNIGELILASSSEVYQYPQVIPTDETVAVSIPDLINPRYSYAGGKIISEIMAINYGRTHFERVVIFRPHNVYGPDMGWEHVIPQFVLQMRELSRTSVNPVRFYLNGTGKETRSFVYVDDFIDGVMLLVDSGEHMNIYHIGTDEEIAIGELAIKVGQYFEKDLIVVPGEGAPGGTPRRCPDITKMAALGYDPKIRLDEGLPIAAKWYDENAHRHSTPGLEESIV
jgi:nucleoside-diphosphate-sugar epimerase